MQKIHDIIIIGGGAAGVTAAIYGYRAGKDILIIEKAVFGGQIIATSEIENYPGISSVKGYSFASELQQQIKDMDIPHVSDEVLGIEDSDGKWKVICTHASYHGRTIIIAAGTKNRLLGIEGEKRYTGHGLSYCATCDGAFYRNKTVAVVGGGNTALEEALYLSLLCRTVYLIHRSDALTGEEMLQKRVSESGNIRTLFNTRILALHGSANLEYLELETSGQSSGYTEILRVDGLFAAIGQIPRNEIFSSVVGLDENGYIIADDSCHTGTEGIFAAGDCRTKQLRQLITAASDGAVAATEAIRFLNKQKNR